MYLRLNLLGPVLVSGSSKNPTSIESVGWRAFVNTFAILGANLGAFLVDRIGRRRAYALEWSVVDVLRFIVGGAR